MHLEQYKNGRKNLTELYAILGWSFKVVNIVPQFQVRQMFLAIRMCEGKLHAAVIPTLLHISV